MKTFIKLIVKVILNILARLFIIGIIIFGIYAFVWMLSNTHPTDYMQSYYMAIRLK